MEFDTIPRMVNPGPIKFNSKRKAGHEAQVFQDWPIALINEHFLILFHKNGSLNVHEHILWRKALLCSYEVNCVAEGKRFNV